MSNEIRPLPPLTREAYAAAREASEPDQEVDDRLACATEAVWSRAWRAAFAEMEQLRDDRDVLGHVGRMYLDALDADPENEMLTLGEAYRVTAVREAVERWEATADVATGRDVGAEGEAG